MKKALIGLANNITPNFEKVKLWALSFKKHSDADVILLCANSTAEEIKSCKDLGIIPVSVSLDTPGEINHKRIKHIRDFISTSDLDLFLSTDVYDVAFQGDPFLKMDTNTYDIFVSGEGLLVKHEIWNGDNINKLFPKEIEKCRDNEIINSGIIAGKREPLVKLYDRMYDLCENHATNKHNIKDQAALIVMIANKEVEKIKIFNLNDGWAMHCAVSGPTHFFTAWGFVNNMLYGVPEMQGGYVISKFGKKYDIVHQFNRVPECHEIIKRGNNL